MTSALGNGVICSAPHPVQGSGRIQVPNLRIGFRRPLRFGGVGGNKVYRCETGLRRTSSRTGWGGSAQVEPLDLTEENVEQVLLDARFELLQLFDTSVGITGVVQLVELDGPFVKVRLTGRFWHERSMVLARVANYLQKRIPEILEVDIEDVSQLDDSVANF